MRRRSAIFSARARQLTPQAFREDRGVRLSRCRTFAAALVAVCAVLPVTEVAAAKRAFGSRPLVRPMKGRDVRVLQDFLTRLGLRALGKRGHYGRQGQIA